MSTDQIPSSAIPLLIAVIFLASGLIGTAVGRLIERGQGPSRPHAPEDRDDDRDPCDWADLVARRLTVVRALRAVQNVKDNQ